MCPIPLSELRKFVLALYSATGRKPATTGRIRQMLDELEHVLGTDATTADLNTAGMTRWLATYRPKRAPETIIGHLGNLRTICAIAQEEGWLERAPSWKRLRPRSRPPTIKRHHSRREIAELLECLRLRTVHLGDWFSWRLYAAVAVAVYTGLRRDELLCLRLVDVDLAEGIIFVVPLPERDVKTPGSVRPVPICPELGVILAAWMPLAGPVHLFPGVKRKGAWRGGKSGHRPADELKAACVAAGIAPGTWQWCRRAWAVHAETAWFFTDPAIDRVMGHSPGSTTSKRWYRRADLDNLRALGQRITYTNGANL
jgi:integrase